MNQQTVLPDYRSIGCTELAEVTAPHLGSILKPTSALVLEALYTPNNPRGTKWVPGGTLRSSTLEIADGNKRVLWMQIYQGRNTRYAGVPPSIVRPTIST